MPLGITGKVVCVDRLCYLAPLGASIEEKPDQLPFLRIDTNTRPASFQKGISLIDQVLELLVSIPMWFRMQPFDIASGANVLLVEKPPDRFATQLCSCLFIQCLPDFLQALAYPTTTRLWLASYLIPNNFC